MEKEKIENEEKSKEEDIDIKIPNVFKKINKKHILEISIVLVFIIALLGTMSVFDGGRLIHPEAPYNFAAGDMFTFSAFSDVARYEEDLTKQPAYLSAGRDDGINFFSMFGAVITAQIADFMNTDTYDYIIHFNLVCLILSIFIIYWFLRKFNVYLAMFSLPITLLVFKWPFNYTINWGMHLSNVNLLFIVASLFAVLHLKKRYMFIALGILNGAGFLSHARETLMFNIGIAIYFILMLIFERKSIKAVFKKEQVSKFVAFFKVSCIRNIVLYIASVPITLIFMFRHLPVLGVFKSSASVGITSSWITKFVNYCPQSKFHHVFMSHFGFYKILIFLGVIFGLYFLFKKKNKLMTLTYSFSIAFLLVGYFCVLGNKTTQIRHLWPLVLMAFVGFVAYFAYLLISQKIKSKKIRIVVVVAIFLLLLVPTLVHHKPQKSSEYGFSDPYTWGTMMWIKDNVPQEDTVLEFYGDRHHQITMFYLMKKNFEQVEPKGLIEKIQVNNMSNDFNIFWNVLHFYMIKDEKEGLKVIPRPYNLTHSFESVCDYEYLFSDKISQNQVVQDYVVRYLNKIIQEGLFVPVYENELSVVLKNAGGDC